MIGERLRAIREAKRLSQGDVEHRTGLLRCYISRVENGHTVPAVETLGKFARALEMPTYQFFYQGNEPPSPLPKPSRRRIEWGSMGKEAREVEKFRRLLTKLEEHQRGLLFTLPAFGPTPWLLGAATSWAKPSSVSQIGKRMSKWSILCPQVQSRSASEGMRDATQWR